MLLALGVAGCQATRTPLPPGPSQAPAPAIPAGRAGAARGQENSFEINSGLSEVLILVHREGPMAKLGHNHVIAVHELRGTVLLADPPEQSRFDLRFPVDGMSVDDPALRATAGEDFVEQVDETARQGTRHNMLGDLLLQSDRYPDIALHSLGMQRSGDAQWLARTQIEVRGQSAVVDIPLQWQQSGDRLRISGEFTLRQTTLGLTPYAVLLGALRVTDEMTIRFVLAAQATQPGDRRGN